MSVVDQRPVSELFSDALSQFSKLIRKELQLARAEMSAKASGAISGMGLLAGAALFVMGAIVLLLMALAAWFQDLGWGAPFANVTAGVIGLVIAAILGGIGVAQLKANSLVPHRTLEQLHQDAVAAKEHV